MKNTSSFARLWSHLKVYKFAVAFAIFLKILSVVMSVVEPFVLGLAITELTNNLLDMAKGVAGAQINVSYVGWVMVLYFVRAIFYEIGSYYSNYFMTNAVQATIRDLRDELSHKINRIPVSYFDRHLTSTSLVICWGVLPATSKLFQMPCSSPFCRLSMQSSL